MIFVALIGIGLFVDVEYDDHIENGRYTYVPEEENKDNEYVEFTINDYDKNNAKLTTKRDRILLDDITELIHSSLKLSDFQQDLNPDYPSKRFVYGYAHDKEIYSLEVEGQKPDGVIEINVYDRVMYLWYYNDLQSNKRGDCLSYSVDVPK